MNSHLTVIFVWPKHWPLIILAVKTLSSVNRILLISWECFLFSWNCGCLFYFLVKRCWILLLFILQFGGFWIHIDDVEIIFYFMVWGYFLTFRFLSQLCYSDFIKTLNLLQRLFHLWMGLFLSFSGFKSCIWSNGL